MSQREISQNRNSPQRYYTTPKQEHFPDILHHSQNRNSSQKEILHNSQTGTLPERRYYTTPKQEVFSNRDIMPPSERICPRDITPPQNRNSPKHRAIIPPPNRNSSKLTCISAKDSYTAADQERCRTSAFAARLLSLAEGLQREPHALC